MSDIAKVTHVPVLGRSITELPHHLLSDILSRVPAKTIFACRCVSKSWLCLTSNDDSEKDFAVSHFSRSPVELLLQPRSSGRVLKSRTLHLVDLECDTIRGYGTKVEIKHKFDLPENNPEPDFDSGYTVVSSCNGLLCLCEPLYKSWYCNPCIVCNPITGEYIMLPKPEEDKNVERTIVSGFGFCPISNQYKVLRMFYGINHDHTNGALEVYRVAEILVVGSDSWRQVGYAPFSPSRVPYPTFLNGTVHWACEDCESSNFIISFDFKIERFGSILPPSIFGENHKKIKLEMSVGVLRGFLSVCNVTPKRHFEIWVMKEYGVQESWSMDFTVDTTSMFGFPQEKIRLIKCLSNGELLMVYRDKYLVCYDPLKNNFRYLKFCGEVSEIETIFHTPSFISLKDVLMADNLKVLNVKSYPRCDELELGKESEALLLEECWSTSVDSN